jgi:hypothetical protein
VNAETALLGGELQRSFIAKCATVPRHLDLPSQQGPKAPAAWNCVSCILNVRSAPRLFQEVC